MQVGDTIEWISRGGTRLGKIVTFVEPGEDVRPLLPPPHPDRRATWRLRSPCFIHCKSRVLVQVSEWGGRERTLYFGPKSVMNNDYIYYVPTCDWLAKVGRIVRKRTEYKMWLVKKNRVVFRRRDVINMLMEKAREKFSELPDSGKIKMTEEVDPEDGEDIIKLVIDEPEK